MTDSMITALIAGILAAALVLALIVVIARQRSRARSTIAARDAQAAAEAKRRCNCVPRTPSHLLWVWLTGRADPLTVICDVDEAHRAYQEILLQTGLYTWRSEFIYDPSVSVLAVDGSFVDVVVPHVQAIKLELRVVTHG
jgi:hypothetical protein